MDSSLAKKDDITYHFLKQNHVDEAIKLLVNAFMREPLFKAWHDGSEDERRKFMQILFKKELKNQILNKANVDNGLSVIALDSSTG